MEGMSKQTKENCKHCEWLEAVEKGYKLLEEKNKDMKAEMAWLEGITVEKEDRIRQLDRELAEQK